MLFSTLILVTFTTCNAFNSMKPTTKFKYVGDTAPLGHFDPLKFSQGKSEECQERRTYHYQGTRFILGNR